jgi:hypothetical protein
MDFTFFYWWEYENYNKVEKHVSTHLEKENESTNHEGGNIIGYNHHVCFHSLTCVIHFTTLINSSGFDLSKFDV